MALLASSIALRVRIGLSAVAGGACVLGVQPAVFAQVAGEAVSVNAAQLLDDYVFYVNTANIELANANALALINLYDRDGGPEAFVGLIEDTPRMQDRFDGAYRRAIRFAELEPVAAQLFNLYDAGRRARARSLREIDANIMLLTGNQRQRLLGRDRLVEASEYAVPSLLEVLETTDDLQLETEVQRLLIDMGPGAVRPLSVALLDVEPSLQEKIAFVLGAAGYESALPYLLEVAQTSEVSSVRNLAVEAMKRIDQSMSASVPVGAMYRELGRSYLAESGSLTTFPGEEFQLVWDYTPALGLEPTEVRLEVYHEAMAMRLAEDALSFDETDVDALAMWVGANFERTLEQPSGYDNPLYGPERRSAMYYAVTAGSRPVQHVLGAALDARDTPVARMAIEALSKNASGGTMLIGPAGRSPLVEALRYPSRRVRYDAALALSAVEPASVFDGAGLVVPLLSSAISEAGVRYALVVSRDEDRQQMLRSTLEGIGYEVLAPVSNFDNTQRVIADVAGVDLVVSDIDGESGIAMIEQIRSTSRLSAAPVIGLMPYGDVARFAQDYRTDDLTSLVNEGVSSRELANAIEMVVERAAGPAVTEAEAAWYASAALKALERLAASQSGAYDVSASARSLLGEFSRADTDVRVRLAGVLAYIDESRAQVAIIDAALDANTEEERVSLFNQAALSAKRFTGYALSRQIDELIQISETGDPAEAEAASGLLGALNLEADRVVNLILGTN